MIKCKKCGEQNRLGLIFCVRCGANLDLTKVVVSRGAGVAGRLSDFIKTITALAFAAAVLCVGLALWPEPGVEEAASARKAAYDSAHAKVAYLAGNRGLRQTFTEPEINAYLAALLDVLKKKSGDSDAPCRILSVRASVKPGAIDIIARAETGKILGQGPYTLTARVSGVPLAGEKGFVFAVKGGAIGHMPLPRRLSGKLAAYMGGAFAGAKHARSFLDEAKDFRLGDGKADILFGKGEQ